MGKCLGSWSGMRKFLEQEMLAQGLRGRIRYGCTTYVGMDGCRIFEVCIDGVQVKRFSLETVNACFIDCGYAKPQESGAPGGYWAEFWPLMQKHPMDQRMQYTDAEFCEALEAYRNQDIQESIFSENPLVRMFAVLDRRIGKRTLEKCGKLVSQQPQWLAQFYRLRLDAEKIRY